MTAPIASGWSGLPGGACTHWKAPPLHGARQLQTFRFHICTQLTICGKRLSRVFDGTSQLKARASGQNIIKRRAASGPALLFDETCHCGKWYTFYCGAQKTRPRPTLVAAMQQIADWLKKLGMAEYAERFAESDIDLSVLRDLTDQDLKDLGVSLGHRRKMLRAIGELAGAVSATPRPAPATEPPQDTAERRQLTVMFCDLVGSTALSGKLDPEDLRGIIGSYHRCCTETIERNGGFVAKYMGDGILSYFGYPQAHEHDAERAVRAGLALVEAVTNLETAIAQTSLQVRVGIATGLVVVGDLIGAGAAQEQAVVGETPNLAARLQALAEPGAVVIASSTRTLTSGLFEYRDLGTVTLKGFAEDVPAWQVLGVGAAESRFEALRATTTRLVGRDEEIDLLMRRWEQAKRGDGCVVLISGEPGIGKSCIAQTVLERLKGEPHTRLRYFCSPHHQDSALYPSIAQLERAAQFRRDDTDPQRLDKLEAVLAEATNDLGEAVPLLAELLSIPTGERYPPLNLTPQKRKEKTLLAQLAQVEGLAAQQPVLMVFEDVHWSDPTTRESLDLLIERVPILRVLVIITFRPEFTPSWIGRPHVTLVSLSRLHPRQRVEMIAGVTSGKALPKEIADQIIDRTDGVPLFIEELTKTVLESGLLADAGDRYTVTRPVGPLAIPTTLHASLLSRLDRLAPTRELAQIGAALGRQFSHELISAVAQMPQHQVDDALAQLVHAELIFRRGTPPDAEYTFKHALVQDAAYSTLLRSRRHQIHSRITSAQQALTLYDPAHPSLAWWSIDPRMTALMVSFRCLTYLGYLEQGRVGGEKAIAIARRQGHAHSAAMVVTICNHFSEQIYGPATLLQQADELEALCTEHGLPYWGGNCTIGSWQSPVCSRSRRPGRCVANRGRGQSARHWRGYRRPPLCHLACGNPWRGRSYDRRPRSAPCSRTAHRCH
jgi:class 3 adenylate cyclase